jgi:hypothetical protein
MTMSFRIVLINLAVFFVPGGFVRSVAERLVFGKAAHANPDRFSLRFDLEGSLVRFHHFAHVRNLARCSCLWQVERSWIANVLLIGRE